MTSEECNKRAGECAANADQSQDSAVASEFLRLAAHWRAIAVRDIFLGHVGEPADILPPDAPVPVI